MDSGRVIKVELEGGFYGIAADDGRELLPVNLPDEFREDGLRIRFETEQANVFTTAMWGTPVLVHKVVRAD